MNNIVDQQPTGSDAKVIGVSDVMRSVQATPTTYMGISCCVVAGALGCYLASGEGPCLTIMGCVLWAGLGKKLGERLASPSQKSNHGPVE